MDIPNHLLPTRLREANGFAHGDYFLEAAPGVKAAHVVNPDFWLHLAARLKRNDRIEVVAQDNSFDMELRVVAVDPRGLYAQMRVLRYMGDDELVTIPASVVAADDDGYVIEQDRVHGWRVLRGGDLVAKNLPDKASAEAARDAHRAGKPVKRAA